MSLSLESCRIYAHPEIEAAMRGYDVARYQSSLNRVNDICLEMGGLCMGKREKFEGLYDQLTKEVESITADESEKKKLYNYVNKIVEIGRNYLMDTLNF